MNDSTYSCNLSELDRQYLAAASVPVSLKKLYISRSEFLGALKNKGTLLHVKARPLDLMAGLLGNTIMCKTSVQVCLLSTLCNYD